MSLDHASGGRFELGIGWGSWADDFSRFGVEPPEPAARVRPLRETLEVLKALWSGETVDYDGSFHHLHGARQAPVPLGRIPMVIGGTGPKTLALVSEYADCWNLPLTDLHRLAQARSLAGDARVSVQQLVAYVGLGADRDAVAAEAARRFSGSRRQRRRRPDDSPVAGGRGDRDLRLRPLGATAGLELLERGLDRHRHAG